MNAAAFYEHEAEITARTIQIEEYFMKGRISTNFFELIDEVSDMLRLRKIEQIIAERQAFYITGTSRVH